MTPRSHRHPPTEARAVRRPLAVVGAALVSLLATAGPALAVPPPEPITPRPADGTGTGGLPVPTTAIPDTLSTAQVMTISLLVSLAVALLVVGVLYVLRRHVTTGQRVVTLPAQRPGTSTAVPQQGAAAASR